MRTASNVGDNRRTVENLFNTKVHNDEVFYEDLLIRLWGVEAGIKRVAFDVTLGISSIE